jgi:hypothetical protein
MGRVEGDRIEGAVVARVDAEIQALAGGDGDAGEPGDRLRGEIGRIGDHHREQLGVLELDGSPDPVGGGVAGLGQGHLSGDVDGAGERRDPAADGTDEMEGGLRLGLLLGRDG